MDNPFLVNGTQNANQCANTAAYSDVYGNNPVWRALDDIDSARGTYGVWRALFRARVESQFYRQDKFTHYASGFVYAIALFLGVVQILVCVLAAPLYALRETYTLIPTAVNVALANFFFTGVFMCAPHTVIASYHKFTSRSANDKNPCNRLVQGALIGLQAFIVALFAYVMAQLYEQLERRHRHCRHMWVQVVVVILAAVPFTYVFGATLYKRFIVWRLRHLRVLFDASHTYRQCGTSVQCRPNARVHVCRQCLLDSASRKRLFALVRVDADAACDAQDA